jgi:hypothetical protein
MVKCEWIHPDRVRFIPDSKMQLSRKARHGAGQKPPFQFSLEKEKDDYIVYSAIVK